MTTARIAERPARIPRRPRARQRRAVRHRAARGRGDGSEARDGSNASALNDITIRSQVAYILPPHTESVTIYRDGEHGPEAEVVAKI